MIRKIRLYGDPILTTQTKVVKDFKMVDSRIRDMIDTLAASKDGIALAANQIGFSERIAVAYIDGSYVPFVNPEIVLFKGSKMDIEGCMSFPGLFVPIERFEKITVEFNNILGNKRQLNLDGIDARALQHEIDHLDGKTFLDRMTPETRASSDKEIKKIEKKGRQYF